MFGFLLSSLLSASVMASGDVCEDWFKGLNIFEDKSCKMKCEVALVDMSTFLCHEKCEDLCSKDIKYSVLKSYGLTDAEVKICDEKPIVCVEAFRLSWKAEKSCLKQFPNSKTNDESDACRHFFWAIYLAQRFDTSTAESILSAHEENPDQPLEEKRMDLENNKIGLSEYKKAKSNKDLDEKAILEIFNQKLEAKEFVVLKPSKKREDKKK